MALHTTSEFCNHSKAVAALIIAAFKGKHLAGNISYTPAPLPAMPLGAYRGVVYRGIPGHTGAYHDVSGRTGAYHDAPGHTMTYRGISTHTGCTGRTEAYQGILGRTNLLGDEDGEVAVFAVDLCAEGHEAQEVDTEGQTPHHQLPVTHVLEERTAVLQQLRESSGGRGVSERNGPIHN